MLHSEPRWEAESDSFAMSQFAKHSFDYPVLGFLAVLTCAVRSMTRMSYAANSYTEERFLILIPISR
ncbi:MAG: hypothetical protein NTAFB09_05170 [Nitrosospira sp.]